MGVILVMFAPTSGRVCLMISALPGVKRPRALTGVSVMNIANHSSSKLPAGMLNRGPCLERWSAECHVPAGGSGCETLRRGHKIADGIPVESGEERLLCGGKPVTQRAVVASEGALQRPLAVDDFPVVFELAQECADARTHALFSDMHPAVTPANGFEKPVAGQHVHDLRDVVSRGVELVCKVLNPHRRTIGSTHSLGGTEHHQYAKPQVSECCELHNPNLSRKPLTMYL